MRRKDREMDKDFAYEIIDKAAFGTLALTDKAGRPYSVPLSIVRDGDFLYFHSAKAGKKHEIIGEGCEAAVSFVGEHKVPDILSEAQLEEIIAKGSHGMLGSKVFTTEFESVMAEGRIVRLDDLELKVKGLSLLCEKYTPDKMKYFQYAAAASLKVTEVYRMEMVKVSGKRKKFDSKGEEMKFGRKA